MTLAKALLQSVSVDPRSWSFFYVFCCFKQFNHWFSWVNIKHPICFCWLKQGFWNAAKTRFIQVHLPLRCWKRLEDCGAVVDSPFSCSWTSKLGFDGLTVATSTRILTYLDPWKSSARWHPFDRYWCGCWLGLRWAYPVMDTGRWIRKVPHPMLTYSNSMASAKQNWIWMDMMECVKHRGDV
jgi:hypothetical protein